MVFNITKATSRHYIKPMLRFVSVPVMVLRSLFVAIMAQQSVGVGQFAYLDSIFNNFTCFYSFRMLFSVFTNGAISGDFAFFTIFKTFSCNFTVFTFVVKIANNFAFYCLAVFFYVFRMANLTFTSTSIFISFVFTKFRKWFELLAFKTLFCLNCLRHSLFPFQKGLCLEPVAAQTAVGLLYYTGDISNVK